MYRTKGESTKSNVSSVDEAFFEKWSKDMAYVLGFFAADGCLTKNSKRKNYYVQFVSTDLDVLEKIKKAMRANQKITEKVQPRTGLITKQAFQIQIGSKKLFYDLIHMGLTPRKSKTIKLPAVPDEYFSNFLRGYFDGDGYSNFCSYFAKDRKRRRCVMMSGFSSGSKVFLESLKKELSRLANTKGGTLCPHNNNFALSFSIHDTRKLFDFMYNDLGNRIFLERKYLKFKSDINKYGSVA